MDNKGVALTSYFLLRFFKEHDHRFRHRVRILFGGSEAVSYTHLLLSLGHRFGGPDLDLNERPANGSVTVIDFDTDKPFGEAVTIVSYGK